MVLTIPKRLLAFLTGLAKREYPRESCAVLLGRKSGEVNVAVKCANAHPDPLRHYTIAPAELIHLQRTARNFKLEIVGFHHSHPDHAAMWSETDLAEANWPICVYLITSVGAGHTCETKAFCLLQDEQGKRFAELAILERE